MERDMTAAFFIYPPSVNVKFTLIKLLGPRVATWVCLTKIKVLHKSSIFASDKTFKIFNGFFVENQS